MSTSSSRNRGEAASRKAAKPAKESIMEAVPWPSAKANRFLFWNPKDSEIEISVLEQFLAFCLSRRFLDF
jgi:hypothetical protein